MLVWSGLRVTSNKYGKTASLWSERCHVRTKRDLANDVKYGKVTCFRLAVMMQTACCTKLKYTGEQIVHWQGGGLFHTSSVQTQRRSPKLKLEGWDSVQYSTWCLQISTAWALCTATALLLLRWIGCFSKSVQDHHLYTSIAGLLAVSPFFRTTSYVAVTSGPTMLWASLNVIWPEPASFLDAEMSTQRWRPGTALVKDLEMQPVLLLLLE